MKSTFSRTKENVLCALHEARKDASKLSLKSFLEQLCDVPCVVLLDVMSMLHEARCFRDPNGPYVPRGYKLYIYIYTYVDKNDDGESSCVYTQFFFTTREL